MRAAAPLLGNSRDGQNLLVAASYTSFGDVRTQGVDLTVDVRRGDRAIAGAGRGSTARSTTGSLGSSH